LSLKPYNSLKSIITESRLEKKQREGEFLTIASVHGVSIAKERVIN
jgi:hypothetical protein